MDNSIIKNFNIDTMDDFQDFEPTKMQQHQPKAPQQTSQQMSQPAQNTTDTQSNSEDSDDELLRRSHNKGQKVYHLNNYTKLDSKISLHMISNKVQACQMKQLTKQARTKDKSQRATVQQVLDPRTRLILLKMLNNGTVSEINGCLSTGKEANVYHAKKGDKQFAIKIYKTSILIFKDRQRYVEGEFRFRNGPSGKNPRKMVKMWAEKELRNLRRLQNKIPCPSPISVKTNVLLMDFIGRDMKAAPKLKDIDVTTEQFSNIYLEVVNNMRILFQECKLVHADLSEYNMLYFDDKVYIIDVSQAVQNDHPHSMDFLRRDIVNINDFFRKKNVHVFPHKRLFDFIVSVELRKGSAKAQLQAMMEEHQDEQEDDPSFVRVYLPRTLEQLPMQKVEKDLKKVQQGIEVDYATVASLPMPKVEQKQDSDSESESQCEEQKTQTIQPTEQGQKRKGGDTLYQGLTKLERKHKVKQEKREKRENKIPKHIKKQKCKKH